MKAASLSWIVDRPLVTSVPPSHLHDFGVSFPACPLGLHIMEDALALPGGGVAILPAAISAGRLLQHWPA